MKISTFVLLCSLPASVAAADVIELDLGRIRFNGETSDYTYDGSHGDLMGTDIDGEQHLRTVATVDLGTLFSRMDMGSIAWIRIQDTGENSYVAGSSPGADIDLFAVAGRPDGISTTYAYEGPNPLYQDFNSGQLASEVDTLDMEYGGGDHSPWWVALGDSGSLTMHFDGWPPAGDPGGEDDSSGGGGDPGDGGDPGGDPGDVEDDGPVFEVKSPTDEIRKPGHDGGILLPSIDLSGFQLRLNEVSPTPEWISVSIGYEIAGSQQVVPGPAMLPAVFGAAALIRRRRR
ncbi:MAG: hypothetical protein ACYTDE_02065 [Planctomycetota bacterium]